MSVTLSRSPVHKKNQYSSVQGTFFSTVRVVLIGVDMCWYVSFLFALLRSQALRTSRIVHYIENYVSESLFSGVDALFGRDFQQSRIIARFML